MAYLLLVATALSLSAQSLIGGAYTKKVTKANAFVYPFFIAVAVLIFFFIYNGFSYTWDSTTAVYSFLFSIAYLLCFIFQLLAMKYGEVSLTSLILSYSLVIPTFWGLIFYREKASVFFYIGMVLLALSLFFINKRTKNKEEDEEQKEGKCFWKWGICVIIMFIGNGMCTVVQTAQQRATDGEFKAELMMTAMLVVAVVSIVGAFISSKETVLPTMKKGWYFGGICGVFNGVVNLFVMLLVAMLPVSLVMPLACGGSLLITYVLSAILFKEKLNLWQNIGFVAGLVAVVLLNL